MKVKKRDGRVVPFDEGKIKFAILKAFAAVDGEADDYAITKANNITEFIKENNDPSSILSVEEIQDIVEKGLMSTKRKDVARAYITYRNERTAIREKRTRLYDTIKEKYEATNVQRQNANVDELSFGGRQGEATSAMNRQYAIDELLSDLARENHVNNRIYIHDLDHYVLGDHNCLTMPIDDLLAHGFKLRQTDIRPAGSVSTALQLVAVLFQVQSLQQFGGVSCSHLDWSMVPYVRRSFYKHYLDGLEWISGVDPTEDIVPVLSIDSDIYKRDMKVYNYAMRKTFDEIDQAVEGLYHNLNSLQSRSGNQLPFSSINYGTCILPEGRMITSSLLNNSIKGIGKNHRTPVFPCGIFQYKKGINDRPGTPNYDLYRLALYSTSKRLYPNYVNCDWSGNAGYDPDDPRTYMSTMGLAA